MTVRIPYLLWAAMCLLSGFGVVHIIQTFTGVML